MSRVSKHEGGAVGRSERTQREIQDGSGNMVFSVSSGSAEQHYFPSQSARVRSGRLRYKYFGVKFVQNIHLCYSKLQVFGSSEALKNKGEGLRALGARRKPRDQTQ